MRSMKYISALAATFALSAMPLVACNCWAGETEMQPDASGGAHDCCNKADVEFDVSVPHEDCCEQCISEPSAVVSFVKWTSAEGPILRAVSLPVDEIAADPAPPNLYLMARLERCESVFLSSAFRTVSSPRAPPAA